MDVYSLYPPNSSLLSGEVIGEVMQRARPSRVNYVVPEPDTKSNQPDVSLSRTNKPIPDQPTKARQKSSHSMDEDQKATLALLLKRRDRRREVCRINQARYVQKQRKITTDLKNGIQKLQEEIKDLEIQRNSKSISVPTQSTVWSAATGYFEVLRLFQSDVKSTPETLETFALRFLRSTMAPDVTDGLLCGPEAILQNWRLLSVYFADIHVELEQLKKGDTANSLVAITTTSVTISSHTLRHVFPHLNSDGQGGAKGGKWSLLADKLRDQRLVMHGSVWFHWDNSTDQVARMETLSDMLTSVLHVLGRLEDVSRVFEGALVTPGYRLIANAHV